MWGVFNIQQPPRAGANAAPSQVAVELEGMIELTLTVGQWLATGVLESNQMSAARAVRRRYYWHGGACLATMRKLRRRPRSPNAVQVLLLSSTFWRCMPCVTYHGTQLCVGGVAEGCNTGPQRSISRIKHDLHRRSAQSARSPAKPACGSRAQRLPRRAHVPLTGCAGHTRLGTTPSVGGGRCPDF